MENILLSEKDILQAKIPRIKIVNIPLQINP